MLPSYCSKGNTWNSMIRPKNSSQASSIDVMVKI